MRTKAEIERAREVIRLAFDGAIAANDAVGMLSLSSSLAVIEWMLLMPGPMPDAFQWSIDECNARDKAKARHEVN